MLGSRRSYIRIIGYTIVTDKKFLHSIKRSFFLLPDVCEGSGNPTAVWRRGDEFSHTDITKITPVPARTLKTGEYEYEMYQNETSVKREDVNIKCL